MLEFRELLAQEHLIGKGDELMTTEITVGHYIIVNFQLIEK